MDKYNENNILGLKFKSSTYGKEIFTIEKDKVTWIEKGNPKSADYKMSDIVAYLNNGSWIPLEQEVVNNYQIY